MWLGGCPQFSSVPVWVLTNVCKREGVTSPDVSQLRCLGSACPHSPPVSREEHKTDTVGVASGLGEAFINRNHKTKGIKVAKRGKVSKITGNLVSSLCCGICVGRAVFIKEGSRQGAESGGRTRSPPWSGARGAAASPSGRVSLVGRGAGRGWTARHPGPSAVYTGAVPIRIAGPAAHVLVARESLNAPFLDPRGHQCACTGKRPVS